MAFVLLFCLRPKDEKKEIQKKEKKKKKKKKEITENKKDNIHKEANKKAKHMRLFTWEKVHFNLIYLGTKIFGFWQCS